MRDRLALPVIGVVSTLVVLTVAFLLLGRQRESQGSYDISALPTLNAFLNGTSAVLLTAGYVFIRLRKVTAHKTCMVTAFGVSSFSDFLFDLPLLRRLRAIWRDGLDSTCVLHPTDLPHCPGRVYRSIGVDDDLPCLDRTVCEARENCPLDAPALALRVGDRGDCVLDALPPLRACLTGSVRAGDGRLKNQPTARRPKDSQAGDIFPTLYALTDGLLERPLFFGTGTVRLESLG